jgi:lipid-binding SYLF domain-containing protein
MRGPVRFLFSLFTAALLALAASGALADSKALIDAKSQEALERLRDHAAGADKLLEKAAGVLVFPDIVKMGFGVGGQYGEGSLLVDGKPEAYYATAGATFGLQLGAQYKTEMILFMTEEALNGFRARPGWEVGVDSRVALVETGRGGRVDVRKVADPVVGFIFSNEGLTHDLSLKGSKIRRIAR